MCVCSLKQAQITNLQVHIRKLVICSYKFAIHNHLVVICFCKFVCHILQFVISVGKFLIHGSKTSIGTHSYSVSVICACELVI